MLHDKSQRRLLMPAPGASAVEPEALNSEQIRARFGSYGIEVAAQQGRTRRSNLYSEHPDGRHCRTFAVVEFNTGGSNAAPDVHAAILRGESIGRSFLDAGWSVEKQTTYIGELRGVPSASEVCRLMRLQQAADLAVHVYELIIRKRTERYHYARIAEVHHPDYLQAHDLQSLFPIETAARLDDAGIDALRKTVLDSF